MRISALMNPEPDMEAKMAISDEEPILVNKAQTLDQMSVEELEQRIVALRLAIEDCEIQIAKKQAQKSAADALFGGGD